MRLRLLVLSAALVALLVAVGARIAELDAGSTTRQSGATIVRGRTELVHADRPYWTEVVVEVCSAALADPTRFEGVRFEIVDRDTRRVGLERTIDPATVRHGRSYSCARLASADPGHGANRLLVRATSDAPIDAIVAGRVVTRRPLAGLDFLLVAGLVFLAGTLLLAMTRSADVDATPSTTASARVTLGIAFAIAALAFVATTRLPLPGTLGGLVRGSLLLAAQLVVVAFAIPRDTRASFGFVRPANLALALGLAPLVAFGVQVVARIATSAIPTSAPSAVARLAMPSAGVAHAETILDPRSGILAIAAVAVVAPVVEELFFRGVVYGSLVRWAGTRIAFVLTALAFVLAHVPQTAGDPAALVSIATLSIAATAMRARFDSVAAPAAMHLVHNGMLVLVGLVASR